jgi:hypothetical protein
MIFRDNRLRRRSVYAVLDATSSNRLIRKSLSRLEEIRLLASVDSSFTSFPELELSMKTASVRLPIGHALPGFQIRFSQENLLGIQASVDMVGSR